MGRNEGRKGKTRFKLVGPSICTEKSGRRHHPVSLHIARLPSYSYIDLCEYTTNFNEIQIEIEAVQTSVHQSRHVQVWVSFRQFESHFEGLMDQNEMVFAFIISQGILSRNFQKLANESHLESTPHFRDQWADLSYYISLEFRKYTIFLLKEK